MNTLLAKSEKFVPAINPLLYWLDSYKVSHIQFETDGVKEIYSNFTPRFDKYLRSMIGSNYDGKVVVFGIQWMVLRLKHMADKGFFSRPKDEVLQEMKDELGPYINQEKYDHFAALHDLGYLPIEIKSLDEGTLIPVGTPFLTIRNTHPDFEWLPNYLETGISMDLWKQLTIATIARIYRKISNEFAMKTTGSIEGTEFQNHDFHSRGASGFESCAISGAAFLTSSCGTDNLSSLWATRNFYDSSNSDGLLAGSVPAGEHSVTTSGILTEQERWNKWTNLNPISKSDAELLYAKKLLTERFPTGIFSYVADSYDYWTFITEILPKLKDTIVVRDGKFVVRGDSGNPVHIIAGYRIKHISAEACGGYGGDGRSIFIAMAKQAQLDGFEVVSDDDGRFYKILGESLSGQGLIEMSRAEAVGTIETLYEIFGGQVNDRLYRVLDSHIGMIYGDGITIQRSKEILTRLEEKHFASTNIVFGIGSYSLGMLSRDHLGMAIKATNTIVDINGTDVDMPIFKDPKTDSTKKSAKGLMCVYEKDGNITFDDECSREQESQGSLTPVFKDGQLMKSTTIFQIRDRIWK